MDKEKVYIFVSHSHADLDKVRLIRNYLESLGAEPILFFLKSKTDEDEIMQLIKDEIDARAWFIYCHSRNAESSTWCQDELKHVKKTHKENITIDIDFCLDENNELNAITKEKLNIVVNGFRELQRIYISASHKDQQYVEIIYHVLTHYGISVFEASHDLRAFGSWEASINQAIDESKYLLLLISENSANSSYVKEEIKRAKEERKAIFYLLIYDGGNYKGYAHSLGIKPKDCYLIDVTSERRTIRSLFNLLNALIDFVISNKLANL